MPPHNVLQNMAAAQGGGGTSASGVTFTQTYSTASATHAALTAADLTDNSTGTPAATIAAGAGVCNLTLAMPANLSTLSTGGVDVATGIVPGYKFKILSWEFITTLAGTGSGASLVFNLEIGTTDVGTVASTCTVTLAGTSDIGERTAATTVTGANTGTSTDAISLEVAAGGTAFTAGSGYFVIKIQNMDTADAIASLAAQTDALLVDLTNTKQVLNKVIDALQTSEVVD